MTELEPLYCDDCQDQGEMPTPPILPPVAGTWHPDQTFAPCGNPVHRDPW